MTPRVCLLGVLLPVALLSCDRDEPSGPTGVNPVEDVTPGGGKPLHRLNKAEYDNTLRELLGVTDSAAADWPDDPVMHGFDNVAEGLSVTPVHVELHELAVDEILTDLFTDADEVTTQYVSQAESPANAYVGGAPYGTTGYAFDETGSVAATLNLGDGGLYHVAVRAFGIGDGDPVMHVSLGDELLAEVVVTGTEAAPTVYEVELELEDGIQSLEVAYLSEEGAPIQALVVDWMRMEGPLDPEVGRPDAYYDLVDCGPDPEGMDGCVRSIVERFGAKAWRRPLTEEEVEAFVGLHHTATDLHLTWYDGVQLALKGLLLSPEFFFRFEQDPVDVEVRDLDGYELATRLSYFLWSGPPDEELTALAANGMLVEDDVLAAQVARMLADPRSDALVDNFAEQWFGVRLLDEVQPSAEVYADFDDDLRFAMQEEIRLVAGDFLLGEASLVDVLTSRETWVNEALAGHYGVAFTGAPGEWVKVSTEGTPRMGLLTSPGWLTANSDIDRSSVVRRGKWILNNLLCEDIPPPPPDVEANAEPNLSVVQSIRDQVETTRTYDPACTGCHSWMDPLGFALEHYDGIGAFRSVDELGFPIDAAAQLPDGTAFRSGIQLGPVIAADPRVPSCAAEKAFIYGLGRRVEAGDEPYVAVIAERFAESGYRFDALVEAVATSRPFRVKAAASDAGVAEETE